MKYTIVSNANENELISTVTEMLKDGWQPQGGISVTLSHDDYGTPQFGFYQAMVLPK